jgi:hypothetical protein
MTTYTWGAPDGDWEDAGNWGPPGGPPTLANGDTAVVGTSVTIGGDGSAAELDTSNESGSVTLSGTFSIGTIFNGDQLTLGGQISAAFIETFAGLSIDGAVEADGNTGNEYYGLIQYGGGVTIGGGAELTASWYLIASGATNVTTPFLDIEGGADPGLELNIQTMATIDASNQIVGGLGITTDGTVNITNGGSVSTTYLGIDDFNAAVIVDASLLQVTQTSDDPAGGGMARIGLLGGELKVQDGGTVQSTYFQQGEYDYESGLIVDNGTLVVSAPSDETNGIDIVGGGVSFQDGASVSASQLDLAVNPDPESETSLDITASTLNNTGTSDGGDPLDSGFSFGGILLAGGSTFIGQASQVTTPSLEVDSPPAGANADSALNTVTLAASSRLSVTGNAFLGVTNGSSIAVNVTDTNTQFLVGGTLIVAGSAGGGQGATGRLFIERARWWRGRPAAAAATTAAALRPRPAASSPPPPRAMREMSRSSARDLRS